VLFYRSYLVEEVIANYWHGLLRDESSRQLKLSDQIHITKVFQLVPIKTAGVMMKMKHDILLKKKCTLLNKCQCVKKIQ